MQIIMVVRLDVFQEPKQTTFLPLYDPLVVDASDQDRLHFSYETFYTSSPTRHCLRFRMAQVSIDQLNKELDIKPNLACTRGSGHFP
eukprot:c28427_g1_i1 orf=3-260(-)